MPAGQLTTCFLQPTLYMLACSFVFVTSAGVIQATIRYWSPASHPTTVCGDPAVYSLCTAVLAPGGVNTTGPVKWDGVQVSEYFEYASPVDGALHQVRRCVPLIAHLNLVLTASLRPV
jgi:hypothetical protein